MNFSRVCFLEISSGNEPLKNLAFVRNYSILFDQILLLFYLEGFQIPEWGSIFSSENDLYDTPLTVFAKVICEK